MRAPLFWKTTHWVSDLLQPVSYLYGTIAARQYTRVTPERVATPILCVGNLVAGGAGKTPVALALYQLLKSVYPNLSFISRGYGGTQVTPIQVDVHHHPYTRVGDEPLLLARTARTCVGKDRVATARLAIQNGADCLIMDDGFQNPSLHKDVSILVVDGGYGFGNGRLIPAGPLREPIEKGLSRADAVVLVDDDTHSVVARISDTPLFRASTSITAQGVDVSKKLIAFAGIGRPEKFHMSLRQRGYNVIKMIGFADHHPYRDAELRSLVAKAREYDAQLVTTEKDFMRIPHAYRDEVKTVLLTLTFESPDALRALILSKLHG
jgi:tetraacyldisaccharide 4'-kinase